MATKLCYEILACFIVTRGFLFCSISVASSSSRRLPIMDLHCSLHCAFLFNCPYSLMLVHSLMSSIHILRGLPFDLLPTINPSMMLTNKFRFGLLTIWPKNDDFRLAIVFNRVGLSFTTVQWALHHAKECTAKERDNGEWSPKY